MAGTAMTPAMGGAFAGQLAFSGEQVSASSLNSYRVTAVAERLSWLFASGQVNDPKEVCHLCLSLSRGIDYAVANSQVPDTIWNLPVLLKQISQHRSDLLLQAAIMVLMISVKNACNVGWFSDRETEELLTLANEFGSRFCTPGAMNTEENLLLPTISTIMARFYPLMKMGHILASLEVKPGYGAHMTDFSISKQTAHSGGEKIHLFVAQKDDVETSACIISPQQVNFLLNGKAVEKRTNVAMDLAPQLPTNVTPTLKYGSNLLQAVGQFDGHYIIVVAFMSIASSSDTPILQDYVPPAVASLHSDSDIIEGASRISLNCPISYKRIKTPVKGLSCKHLQCFDFSNYVDINSRRPSWRCPNCNQHVCYTDIRIDQNMATILKEVGDNVEDVIIFVDGSWKAVMETDGNVDQAVNCFDFSNYVDINSRRPSWRCPNCNQHVCYTDIRIDQNMATILKEVGDNVEDVIIFVDGSWKAVMETDGNVDQAHTLEKKQQEPSSASNGLSDVLDLTNDGDEDMANADIFGTEDVKPFQTNLCPQSATPNTNGVIQNLTAQVDDDFFSGLCLPHNANSLSAPPLTDGSASLSNLPHNPLLNSEFGRAALVPEQVMGTPVAMSQLPNLQQRSRVINFTIPSSTYVPPQNSLPRASTANERPQHLARSHLNGIQNRGNQEHPFIPGQPGQQAAVLPPPSPNQLHGSYRTPTRFIEFQNSHLQQAFNQRMPYEFPNQSPTSTRPPPHVPTVPTTQTHLHQPGAAATANLQQNTITQFMAAAIRTAMQITRQPQTAPPSSTNAYSFWVPQSVSRIDDLVSTEPEQNWRPTGRMRGSLQGSAYSAALNQFMTQNTQAANPTPPPLPTLPDLPGDFGNQRS